MVEVIMDEGIGNGRIVDRRIVDGGMVNIRIMDGSEWKDSE